jgi:hypothetical protein
MARGLKKSPQRKDHPKRRKSQKKLLSLIQSNQAILSNLYETL